jgi:hypothetical protein
MSIDVIKRDEVRTGFHMTYKCCLLMGICGSNVGFLHNCIYFQGF